MSSSISSTLNFFGILPSVPPQSILMVLKDLQISFSLNILILYIHIHKMLLYELK